MPAGQAVLVSATGVTTLYLGTGISANAMVTVRLEGPLDTRAFTFSNNSYGGSIRYTPELEPIFGDDTFQRYVNNEIQKFGSLEMFVKTMLPTLKLIDPNGIIAIEPEDVDTIENEEGEEVISNDLIKPLIHI